MLGALEAVGTFFLCGFGPRKPPTLAAPKVGGRGRPKRHSRSRNREAVVAVRREDVTLANWQVAPYLRWAFQNCAALMLTKRVSRGHGGVLPFRVSPTQPLLLDQLAYTSDYGHETTVRDALQALRTDALVVLHRGAVIAELYDNGMTATTLHLAQSVSKSVVAVLAGCLAAAGQLRLGAAVTEYVPELWGTGFEGATVQQLLDMTTGVGFSEQYYHDDDTGSDDMLKLCVAGGWHPHDSCSDQATSIYDFLTTLPWVSKHGRYFQYQSANTECLQWVLERASGGIRLPELLSVHIWSKLGCESDGNWTVDPYGAAMASGGFSATARDLARLGQLLRDGGRNLRGDRVVAPAWVEACRTAPEAQRARFQGSSPHEAFVSAYSNSFWLLGEEEQCFAALGIHGQCLFVNPEADLVIVKLSSLDDAFSSCDWYRTFEAFEAITAAALQRPVEQCRLHVRDAAGWRPRGWDVPEDQPAASAEDCTPTFAPAS